MRDKVAASRAKGKWMEGTVPLGYQVKDKKLIPHPSERKTVDYIFKRYLDLKSLQSLIDDLNEKGIVTKRRDTELAKYQGAIPFTHGPLAYPLKNRTYLGETRYKSKWFAGEHEPMISQELFDAVQAQLASNAITHEKTRSTSGALLLGLIYDELGNRMSPSYSVKKDVRYRFYVSSAILRGHRDRAGSITRINAIDIEALVGTFLSEKFHATQQTMRQTLQQVISRIDILPRKARITLHDNATQDRQIGAIIEMPFNQRHKARAVRLQAIETIEGNPKLIASVVRAHAWRKMLLGRMFNSIEDLAASINLHPKILRGKIKWAFVAPSDVVSILGH